MPARPQRQTVAIPFASGIQPQVRARLLDPVKLITAQNCYYFFEQGPQKRNGHVSRPVRTGADYPGFGGLTPPTAMPARDAFSTANPGIPASWLYGWGIRGTEVATTTDPFEVSPQPDVGQLFGLGARDSEVVAWDGHRVFSYAAQQVSRFGETQTGTSATTARGPATIPALRATTLAKISGSQLVPCAADNGVIRMAAWLSADGITGGYSAFDSVNGACLVGATTLTYQTPKSLRCLTVGPWFHILVSDTTANSLEVRSFHQDTPGTVISRSLGPVDVQFDVKKISETQFAVLKSKAGALTVVVLKADGSSLTSFVPALGGFAATAGLAIALEVDVNGMFGVAWQTTGAPITVNFATYNQAGGTVTARQAVTTLTQGRRMTLSPRVVAPATGPLWDVFVEDQVASVVQTRVHCVVAGVSSTQIAIKQRVVLASHAFRVGNRNFVWAAPMLTTSNLQPTWYLLDSGLLPVGKLDYGLANVDTGTTLNVLPSVNWHVDDAAQPFASRVVFHGALPYNQRVVTNRGGANVTPNGVFTEPSVRFYQLDFLPPFRSGQAGRTTYVAGAQLWAYDGVEMVEAGFHMAPEQVTLALVAGGGALSAGTYRARVDLCHRNAQNEEVRSWSIITNGLTVAANDRFTVTIPNMPFTRREDSYFLVFVTEANGTVYYLANSRDPSSANFIRNTSTATYTFTHSIADSALIAREYHPANSGGNYLDPLPAPACEIVAAGRDRLWLAGGELAPGEVAPSRLFFPGQTPAFTPALSVQVDRNAEPVTAIGFVGEVAVIFRRTATYVLDSDGPDNSLNGSWSAPRLSVADTGATGQETLALTTVGLWFQSPAGIRLITSSGSMDRAAGLDVDPIAVIGQYSSAVVVPQYTQVRWYSQDATQPTLVLDYSSNSWTTWTGLDSVGAVFWPVTNLAIVAKPAGAMWTETLGVYTDGGSPYEMLVRTSWLRAAQLGDFQRVRRFALFGSADPAAPHTLRTRVYYNERNFLGEEFLDIYPGLSSDVGNLFNPSGWGQPSEIDFTWGDGVWGDNSLFEDGVGQSALSFRDGLYRIRHRPARQKCSVISFEFSDGGAQNSGFQPVVLALELAVKPGLDRIATATS